MNVAGYEKTKVVVLSVALPHVMHYALKEFCDRATDEEMRPVTQAEIARLCIIRFLRAKGIAVTIRERDVRTNFSNHATRKASKAASA